MPKAAAPLHEFTLIFTDPDGRDFVDLSNALYEAGCDDASVGSCEGVLSADFHRTGPSLLDAILSAVREVESTGAAVVRVEPDAPANLPAAAAVNAVLELRRHLSPDDALGLAKRLLKPAKRTG